MAGQRQLAGHREWPLDFGVFGQGKQRGRHGDAGAGAILGGGAFRHMQVDEAGVEKRAVGTVAFQVRGDITGAKGQRERGKGDATLC